MPAWGAWPRAVDCFACWRAHHGTVHETDATDKVRVIPAPPPCAAWMCLSGDARGGPPVGRPGTVGGLETGNGKPDSVGGARLRQAEPDAPATGKAGKVADDGGGEPGVAPGEPPGKGGDGGAWGAPNHREIFEAVHVCLVIRTNAEVVEVLSRRAKQVIAASPERGQPMWLPDASVVMPRGSARHVIAFCILTMCIVRAALPSRGPGQRVGR